MLARPMMTTDESNHLYLQVSMHQGCDLRCLGDESGGVLCCPRFPNLRKEGSGEGNGADSGNKGSMDSPSPNNKGCSIPNRNTNRSGKNYSNSRMDRSSRSTNRMMG